jgi:hypothetical protein
MSQIPQDQEQTQQENYPAYYAVIPADVRYCKDLSPNAKLLYGEITALCNKNGYCWAGDKYFADLYEVDVRSIKNWMASLKNLGFIETEPFNHGFHKKRRIYIVTFKKCLPREKKFPIDGDEIFPMDSEEIFPSYIKKNNTVRILHKQQQEKVAKAPVRSAKASVVVSSSQEKKEEDADQAATEYIESQLKRGNPVNETRIRKQALKEGWKPNKEKSKKALVDLFKNGSAYEGKLGSYECYNDEYGIGFLPLDFYAPQPSTASFKSPTFRKDLDAILEKFGLTWILNGPKTNRNGPRNETND